MAIRPILMRTRFGRKYRICSGVPVRDAGLLDINDVSPNYKQGLATLVKETVRPGETIVEIGGGRGVMTVLAARQAESVISYEPGEEMVELMIDTLNASCVSDSVTIKRAIVGELNMAYGSPRGAAEIPANELPECDGMILDCEGAERVVFSNMTIQPEWVIVEPHPSLGAELADLESILGEKGYRIDESRPLAPTSEKCAALFKPR